MIKKSVWSGVPSPELVLQEPFPIPRYHDGSGLHTNAMQATMLPSRRPLGRSLGQLPRACPTLTPHRPQYYKSSLLVIPQNTRSLCTPITNPPILSPIKKSTTIHPPVTANSLLLRHQIRTMSAQAYTPRDGDPVLPLFSLKGKTAIVTGAGAGIGYAVADCFAEAGADVLIWYNSNSKAKDAAEEIAKRWGVKCKAYQVDVTNQQAVESAVREQVDGELGGRLDIFVANAGIPWTKGAILDIGQDGVSYLFTYSTKLLQLDLRSHCIES